MTTTVTSEAVPLYFGGNGSTTVFAWSTPLYNTTDLKAILTDANGTDSVPSYTVVIASDNGSATVTLDTAPAVGETLTIYLDVELHQEDDYPEGGEFPEDTFQDQLNRAALQDQGQQQQIDRSLKIPITVDKTGGGVSTELPKPEALHLWRWNAANNAIENISIDELVTSSYDTGNYSTDQFAAGVDFTAGSSTTLTLGASVGTENNTQVYFDGVYQNKSSYTVSAGVITFDAAIPASVATIEVVRAGVLTASTVADGAITTAKIEDSAVTTAKIADDAVTSAKIATGAVVADGIGFDVDDLDDSATTNKFTTAADISKLAGIEAGADVTDGTNVEAAGAVMESGTTLAGVGWFLDEDDMFSNSSTKAASQQSIKQYAERNVGRAPDIILQDQKSSGTNGGSASAGMNIRDLNTEVRDVNGDCSLSSNQFTLTAGTYYIEAVAPAFRCGAHQIYIYNTTDTSNISIVGRHGWSGTGNDYANTDSILSGVFTIGSSKALELRHDVQTAKTTNGLGVGSSAGITTAFSEIRIWRLA